MQNEIGSPTQTGGCFFFQALMKNFALSGEKKGGSQKFTLVSGYLIHVKFSFDALPRFFPTMLGSAEVHTGNQHPYGRGQVDLGD